MQHQKYILKEIDNKYNFCKDAIKNCAQRVCRKTPKDSTPNYKLIDNAQSAVLCLYKKHTGDIGMARFKRVDREQGVMIPISYGDQILPGTFEHALDYIVENRINTSAMEARYANAVTGASAYSPKTLLKIILFAYSRGIISSRRIEKACVENIIFMALTGGQAPDFTTIAWFVRSLKDDIKNIFRDVLLICCELDLLGGTEFAIDGCKMSSNASKEWSGTFSDLEKKKEKFESSVKYLLEKHRSADRGDSAGEDSGRLKKQIEKIEKKTNKIENFLRENEPKPNSRKGERQSNITDNESAKMKTSHGVIQGYNGMAINDSKNQVIIEAGAFGSGQEQISAVTCHPFRKIPAGHSG